MNEREEALPVLGYSPNDFPRLTGGAISRTRVFEDIKAGRLQARKVGQRTIITPEEAKRYRDSFPVIKPAERDNAAA
jgi:hypothetical protein